MIETVVSYITIFEALSKVSRSRSARRAVARIAGRLQDEKYNGVSSGEEPRSLVLKRLAEEFLPLSATEVDFLEPIRQNPPVSG
jgi:hypothetical protein